MPRPVASLVLAVAALLILAISSARAATSSSQGGQEEERWCVCVRRTRAPAAMDSLRRRLFDGVANPASAGYRIFLPRAELAAATAADTSAGDRLVADVRKSMAASTGTREGDWVAEVGKEGDFSLCRWAERLDVALAATTIRRLPQTDLKDRVAFAHTGRCQQQPSDFNRRSAVRTSASGRKQQQRTAAREQPNVTPAEVSAALGLPVYINGSGAPPATHHPRNMQAFFQSGQRTILDALTQFGDCFFAGLATNDTFVVDRTPFKVRRFVGGANPTEGGFAESNLDAQYLLGVSLGVPTWAFSYPDGDFCADLLRWSADVVHLITAANESRYPLVISLSYAVQDAPSYCPASALRRLDDDAVLMGLAGITLVAASGDYGPGLQGLAGWNFGFFSAAVPASLPGFLAVGATHINTTVCASSYSGGGFSAVFNNSDAGSHRKDAVAAYLRRQQSGIAGDAQLTFNGSMRSTPDVAAPGTNFEVFIQGLTTISGTSASTPVIAGLISRLNDVSLESSGQPLGHVGQLFELAAQRGCFHDTTAAAAGYEGASVNAAWPPAPGWDACSGYGVPQYPCLASLVRELAVKPAAASDEAEANNTTSNDDHDVTLDEAWRVELPAERVLSVAPAHFRDAGIVVLLLVDGSAVGVNVSAAHPSIAWRNVALGRPRTWLPSCAILATDAPVLPSDHHGRLHHAAKPIAVVQTTAGVLRIDVAEGWTVWELPRTAAAATEASHCLALANLPPTKTAEEPPVVALVGFVFDNATVTAIDAATGGPRFANVTILTSFQPALPAVNNADSFLGTTIDYPFDRAAGPALAAPALHWNASECTPLRCTLFASLAVYHKRDRDSPITASVVAVAFDFAAALRNCTGRRAGEASLASSSSTFFATAVTAMGEPGDGTTRVLLQGLTLGFSTNVGVRTVDAVKGTALFNPSADQPMQWSLTGSAPLATFPSRGMMVAPSFAQSNAVHLWRWSGDARAGYVAGSAMPVQLCGSEGVVSCGAAPMPSGTLALCTCVSSEFGNTSLHVVAVDGEGGDAHLQLLGSADVAAPASLSRAGVLTASAAAAAAGPAVNVATVRGSYNVLVHRAARTVAIRGVPMLQAVNGFSLGAINAAAATHWNASATCDLAASLSALGCWRRSALRDGATQRVVDC